MKFLINLINKVMNLFTKENHQNPILKQIQKLDEIHKTLKSLLIKTIQAKSSIESKISYYENLQQHLTKQATEYLNKNDEITARSFIKQKVLIKKLITQYASEIYSHQQFINNIINKLSHIENAKTKLNSQLELLQIKNKKLDNIQTFENIKLSLIFDLEEIDKFVNEALIIKDEKEKILQKLSQNFENLSKSNISYNDVNTITSESENSEISYEIENEINKLKQKL